MTPRWFFLPETLTGFAPIIDARASSHLALFQLDCRSGNSVCKYGQVMTLPWPKLQILWLGSPCARSACPGTIERADDDHDIDRVRSWAR
jgi:hypothetical protein